MAGLTLAGLSVRNDFGDTPLHAAALEGHLLRIPRALLNEQTLTIRNYNGSTPRDAAISRGYTHQLPEELRPKALSAWQKFIRRFS